MKRFLFLFATATSFCRHAQKSVIIEHHYFHQVLNWVQPEDLHNKTVIILDIDNTLAHPEAYLIGSEEWVAHMICTYGDTTITDPKARFACIAPLYYDVIHAIHFQPVESITIEIIKELQNSGVIVVGLTARSFEICDRTIEQLNSMGIDLSHASLWHEQLWHDCHLEYCHKDGIIFCNGNDKGTVLTQLFERLNYKPTKIIAVDDKERHLQSIARALHPKIEFVGIRYAHLDEKVRNFDSIAADEELLEWIIWQWLLKGY
jgi:predicted phosphatase